MSHRPGAAVEGTRPNASLVWLPATPPPDPSTVPVAAGVHWDAVRAPWSIARHALPRLADLGDRFCAVLYGALAEGDDDDPDEPGWLTRPLYWFIPPGRPGRWDIPGVHVLTAGGQVEIPPVTAMAPTRPHWHRVPLEGAWLADPYALRAALVHAAAWERQRQAMAWDGPDGEQPSGAPEDER